MAITVFVPVWFICQHLKIGKWGFAVLLKHKVWPLWDHIPRDHPLVAVEEQLPTIPPQAGLFTRNTRLDLVGMRLWDSHSDVSGIGNGVDCRTMNHICYPERNIFRAIDFRRRGMLTRVLIAS